MFGAQKQQDIIHWNIPKVSAIFLPSRQYNRKNMTILYLKGKVSIKKRWKLGIPPPPHTQFVKPHDYEYNPLILWEPWRNLLLSRYGKFSKCNFFSQLKHSLFEWAFKCKHFWLATPWNTIAEEGPQQL